MSEQVNHPSHYCKAGRKECIVEMEEKYGVEYTAVFALLSAYKYGYRAGDKEDNPSERDIGKANWYYGYVTEKLLDKVYRERLYSDNFNKLYADIGEMLEEQNRLEDDGK